MKLKSKLLFLLLCGFIFNLQSQTQTTETITEAEAQSFVQEALWFWNYDWQNKEKPSQDFLNFFSDSLRSVLQKDERLYINRQGLVGAQISGINLPWIELHASTELNDNRWNKKWKILLKKENGQLFIVPKIQREWRSTSVYLWKQEKNISPQELTVAEKTKQREEVLAYLAKRYPNVKKSKYQEKDFYGKWRIDSTFSYYKNGSQYAYAGNATYNLKSGQTYTKVWEKLYSYVDESEYNKQQTHTDWWMIWKDKMIQAEGKRVTIMTLESKSEHQFELVQRNQDGKITFRQRFTNLSKKKQEPIPIELSEIEVIIQPKYDDIQTFYEGEAVVQLNGKYGSIDTTGAIGIPIIFDHLSTTYGDPIYAFKDGKRVKINTKGEILKEKDYKNSFMNYANDRVIVENGDGKMILRDTFDHQILPTAYDKIQFYGDRSYKVQQEEKWGLLLERGDFILPVEYDNFWEIDPYLFAVQKDEKWGMWNVLSNEFSIPLQYKQFDVSDEYIVALLGGELQLLDAKTFEMVDIPKYDLMDYQGNNHFGVEKEGKRGIVDIENKIILPIKYDDFTIYGYDKQGIVKRDGLQGLIDHQGKEILPIQYEYLQLAYNKDFAIIGTEEQKGIINLKGDTIIPVSYEEITFPYEPYQGFGEEWIRFKKGNKYGYMDLNQEIIIPAEYDIGLYFYDKITTASKNGKFGIINTKNEVVLDFLFDEIRIVRESPIFIVKYKGYYGLIRKPEMAK